MSVGQSARSKGRRTGGALKSESIIGTLIAPRSAEPAEQADALEKESRRPAPTLRRITREERASAAPLDEVLGAPKMAAQAIAPAREPAVWELKEDPPLAQPQVAAPPVAEPGNSFPPAAAADVAPKSDGVRAPSRHVTVQEAMRGSGRITETDLVTPDGRGVFDDFTTNMTKIRYEKGVTYNDLLPMNFTRGFNNALETVSAQLTNRQNEDAKRLGNYLSREIKESGRAGIKLVRSSSLSLLHRSLQDFFIRNAPKDCFDGVGGEQEARHRVGLLPLPELEIYERAIEKHDLAQGPMNPRVEETDLSVPGGGGVFDGFSTNLHMFRFEKGVEYNDLLPLTFNAGFNSGLERSIFQVTLRQLEEAKKYSTYLTREIKARNSKSQPGIRANAVSMLHRIMLDYFITYAPAGCFDGVSGEQHLRRNLGLPPLPELTLFEHEMNKVIPLKG